MDFNFLKKKGKPFIVLDIGTEAVKAGIFVEKKEKTEVLQTSISNICSAGVFSGDDPEIEAVGRAVKSSLEEIYFSFRPDPKATEVFALLPPDKVLAKVVSESVLRENSLKKISLQESQNLERSLLEKARKKTAENFAAKAGILEKDLEWLKAEITEKRLEGYKLNKLEGKKGSRVDFKILLIFSPGEYLKRVKEIFKDLDLKITSVFHLAQIVSVIFQDKETGKTILDVGGSHTQAFFIRNDCLDRSQVFSKGGKDFTDRLQDVLNLDTDMARNLKERYSAGLLEPEISARVKDVFNIERASARKEFDEIISQRFPVYLLGGGSALKDFRRLFYKRKFILPKSFKKVIINSKSLRTAQIVPILLTALFKNAQKNI